MHIGFTGTQEGMTARQYRDLAYNLIEEWDESLASDICYFHHGDCVGADAQAHELAWYFGYHVIVHPPTNESKRAFKNRLAPNARLDEVAPRPYLDRNRDIADASDTLIAAPKGPEVLRSGTWSTVRYALKIGKPVVILEP